MMRRGEERRVSASALAALLLLAACDDRSTVGYNESQAPASAVSQCSADTPIGRCEIGPCVVSDLFHPSTGSVATAVDSESVYFLSSPVLLSKYSLGDGAIDDLTDVYQLMWMTTDDEYLYWTENNGAVRALAKSGGTPFDATSAFGNPTQIVSDSDYLYWLIPNFGQVAMAPKPLGDPTQISGQLYPTAIGLDATHVYWVNEGDSGPFTGQLLRAVRGNLSSAEVLRADLDAPIALTLGAVDVYWASKNAVFAMPKAGGDPVELAGGFQEIKVIAAYRDSIYGVGQDGLWKLPTAGGAPFVLDQRGMLALALACSGVYAGGWFESVFVRYAP